MTERQWSRWPGVYRNWPATLFMWAYAIALIVGLFSLRSISDHPWDTVIYIAAVLGWVACSRALAKERPDRHAP